MPRIEEGQLILAALGLPRAQCTAIAAYTLLALADVGARRSWGDAKQRSIRIHDILLFTKDQYKKTYAENTRETVRRQVLHQFEQARVVDRNPDDPTLPTNSPRTHYALSEAAVRAIRSFGTPRFTAEAEAFQRSHGSLLAVYRAQRAHNLIPVTLPSGAKLQLSPGKHNEVQAAILNEFAPRFAPGAAVLYIGDTLNKTLHVDVAMLEELGIPVTKHDKLPDVVLYIKNKKWLYLIEAVTSHGPVSPKRFQEIEATLSKCGATRVYVSAFPDFAEFKRHAQNIAWETEVWLADIPDHMIHFNGDKFLGPAPR